MNPTSSWEVGGMGNGICATEEGTGLTKFVQLLRGWSSDSKYRTFPCTVLLFLKKIIALLIYSSHIIQFTYSKYTMQLFFVHSQSCTIITTIDLWTSSSPPKETLYPWAVIVITGRGKNTFKLEEKRWVGRTVWGKQRRPRLSRGHAVWSQVPCPLWFLVSSQYKYVFTEHLPCARLQARYVTDIHDHSL